MGEIAVAGHVLARSYVNNARLTAKRFVEAPDLAAGLTPSRIYLTGDIGRCTADGSICLVGRKVQMVKVNGIRVESAESSLPSRSNSFSNWEACLLPACFSGCETSNQSQTSRPLSRSVLADVEQQYSATNVSRDAPTPFSSFVQYVTELRKAPQGQNYWKQNLKGFSVTALPQIKMPAHFEANQKYSMHVQLPVDDRHSLATIAEAAWDLPRCRYTELEDVSFGCVSTGRTAPLEYINSIVGPTMVTVPRRVFAPWRQVVGSYLESIEATIIDTLPWEQFGQQNIRKLGADAHNACQFSSLLVVQLLPPESETATSKTLIPQTIRDSVFKEDYLTMECQPRGNHLLISMMYDDRAIVREEVGWIAYNFSRLLSELDVKRRQTLDELDIIGLRGTKQVQMWNSSAPAPSPTRVDHASDALLTYAELDALSSKPAARLGSLGIASGTTVPLLMSKGAVVIVSMLAMLKAGAAYVLLALDSAKHQL
ncbi:hypothetical protein MHUMG1_10286 [Metarhizium humberi]|uniref:Uncharacterized protein n=1 Tax=Metarhizium humberi TaxID=2596975 RepID=A0A9P8S2B6_9HYPO|nr:hypothetical protein MHUMG1_10286 [Metarhizium humberi]